MGTAYRLESWHVDALLWFEENANRVFPNRPFDVGLPIKVSSLQKGIWKPAGIPYAVSVVQTHKGVYDDQDPILHPTDGTWQYFYHQQGKTAEDFRDPGRHFANEALFRCMADGIPVGVIIPGATGRGYQVLGLAMVAGYNQGFFELVGPVSVGIDSRANALENRASVTISLVEFPLEPFNPAAEQDDRIKVIRAVHRRQGAPRFRRALLQAYEGTCAMTRFDAEPALEAAHIVPYRGPQTNHPANGLLLRADMHDLFDLGLVAVDTSTLRLTLAKALEGTKYERYHDQPLWIPRDEVARPSVDALDMHRERSAVA
ncbi:MAG: HNH endonuclease [Actinobacteria bacterium]|nr:MAG: HNH endonuclease [Actinomycetota bacterium]